ncbi:hypothetical protein M011DRAFT_526394 [Sporormia fimetaria CBS 119925]|uniref:Uncharacterized protein n=1 Tax=Sporormia fimetaria CBS 119925 TaxID=1340428 RepID=A0A6A6VCG9_9PLEO|nr:hypothetical protein M011DRAFT_526394 [Sporormia fimetaria CBS 119925]
MPTTVSMNLAPVDSLTSTILVTLSQSGLEFYLAGVITVYSRPWCVTCMSTDGKETGVRLSRAPSPQLSQLAFVLGSPCAIAPSQLQVKDLHAFVHRLRIGSSHVLTSKGEFFGSEAMGQHTCPEDVTVVYECAATSEWKHASESILWPISTPYLDYSSQTGPGEQILAPQEESNRPNAGVDTG